MSLYADYNKEREDFETIEVEHAFIDYKIFGEECYVRNVYVTPEKRKTGLVYEMYAKVEDIARKSGCKFMTGTVVPSAKGSTRSLKVLIDGGAQLLRSENNLIVFTKRL